MRTGFQRIRGYLRRSGLPLVSSTYEERWGSRAYGSIQLPLREVLRDGEVIGVALTAHPVELRKPNFLEPEYCPPFAIGRCMDISDGDYKTVVIDRGGTSDHVIKRFNHSYRDAQAWEMAKEAAERVAGIYQTIEETSRLHILPFDVFPGYYSNYDRNTVCVYEKQRRGIFCDPALVLSSKEVDRVQQEMDIAAEEFYKKTMPELVKRKLVHPDRYGYGEISEHIALSVSWDLISQRIVANDVVDRVYVDAEINKVYGSGSPELE